METSFPPRLTPTDFYFGQDLNSQRTSGTSERRHHNMLMAAPKIATKNESANSLANSDLKQSKLTSTSQNAEILESPVPKFFQQSEPKAPSLLTSNLTTITFQAPSKVSFIRGHPTDFMKPEDDEEQELPKPIRHSPESPLMVKTRHRRNNSYIDPPTATSQSQQIQQPSQTQSPKITSRSKSPGALQARVHTTINKSVISRESSPTIAVLSVNLDRSGNVSQNGGPAPQKYMGSTAHFYHEFTDKLIEDSFKFGFVPGQRSAASSPLKSARSTVTSASPLRKALESPSKTRNPKMQSLVKGKLVGSPDHKQGARVGIQTVRITLDEALDEKDALRRGVHKLKQAIQESKAEIEKTRENNKFLTLYMECLGKKNDHLDKNTIGLQALVNRTREEVNQMEVELDYLSDKMVRMNKQRDFENERIEYLDEATRLLKMRLLDEIKAKNQMRDACEHSRVELKRTMDLYSEAAEFQKTILFTLEDGFKKYGKDG